MEPLLRKRKSPRRRTGSRRVRERFELVEIPLKRTNQSQNVRQRLELLFILIPSIRFAEVAKGFGEQIPFGGHGRGLGGELEAGFFDELEIPKLIRKNLKPLRSESMRLMRDLPCLVLVWWFGCGWMIRSFGRGSGSAIQDVESRLGHRLIGVCEEDADLPHLRVTKLGLEGGHSGQPDTVFNFPVGFADRVIADANDIGLVLVRVEELRRVGVHVAADRGGVAVKSMADCAAVDVDVSAGGEVGGIGLHVRSDHFPLDACVEGNVNELSLHRERRIGYGNGDLAVHQIGDHDERNQNNSNDQAKDEAHGLLPPPQNFIVEHGNEGWRQKAAGCVQKKSVPIKVVWGLVCDN